MNLNIPTPRWAKPLLQPSRYKGAKGGRSSGKSHFFAERVIEHLVCDPNFSVVVIREVQRSLRYSMKRLLESKIEALGVGHLFDVQRDGIYRRNGRGLIIFQGMQDHTADSIKSLEGFDLALCEEAQTLSARSLELLLPTIRNDPVLAADGSVIKQMSEIWFIWNPDQETDPVDQLLVKNTPDDAIVVHVNFTENPFCPQVSNNEALRCQQSDPDKYDHIWMGGYNTKSDDQVLSGKWVVDEFEPGPDWDGPYYGGDWGFSTDPTTLVQNYIHNNRLYIYKELYGHGVEVDDLEAFYDKMPGAKKHIVRADSARPELVSHMNRHNYPRVQSVNKWPGSVEDGITKMRGFERIVIHTQCPHAQEEARLWKYKRDRLTQDVLAVLIKGNDHIMDAVRYSIEPLIKRSAKAAIW